MALIEVSTLAQLEDLLAAGVPRALHLVAAESLRSAAAMLQLLEAHGVIPTEEVGEMKEGEEEQVVVGGGSSSTSSEDGDAAAEVDDDAAGDDTDSDSDSYGDSDSDTDDDDNYGDSDSDTDADDDNNNWVVEGVDSLRRAAGLADLLIEMSEDVIPALAADPGRVTTLHRLRDLGKDVRRAGLLVPGNAGRRAVTLGNKTQKLVSHAFNTRKGFARSVAGRRAWIAARRMNLLNQVNGALLTAVVLG